MNVQSLTSLRSSKKLLKKLDKYIPGASSFLDISDLNLSTEKEALLELASSLILNSEKKKKLVKAGKTSRIGTKRRQFSKLIQQKILILQKFSCNQCKTVLEFPEFDHIDGNSLNNDISNCQALCPNCHAKKTRKSRF